MIASAVKKWKNIGAVLGFFRGGLCLLLSKAARIFKTNGLKADVIARLKHNIISSWLDKKYWIPKKYESNIIKEVRFVRQMPSNTTPIWVYWHQGWENAPPLIKMCQRQAIRMQSQAYQFVWLDNYNLSEYLVLPQWINEKILNNELQLAQYSDIIRFALLYGYGGGWVDADIFISKPIEIDFSKTPYFSIKRKTNNPNYYVSKCNWVIGVLFSQRPKLPLMRYMICLLLEYYKSEQGLIDYFLTDYFVDLCMKRDRKIKEEWDRINESNPNLFSLMEIGGKVFHDCESVWKRISSNTTFFVTSTKQKYPDDPNCLFNKCVFNRDMGILKNATSTEA